MNILFLAYNPTSLKGCLAAIENLKTELFFTPYLLCQGCYFESAEINVINTEKKEFDNKSLGNQKQKLTSWYNLEDAKAWYQIKSFFCMYKYMRNMDKKAKKILSSIEPEIIIATDDRIGGLHMAFLKNAEGIPVIKIPVMVQTDYKITLAGRKLNKALVVDNSIFNVNNLQKLIKGNQIREINTDRRSFFQVGEAFACYLSGMLPRNPWVSGASKCDYVLAVSEVEKQRVLECINPKIIPIVVTGLQEDYSIVYGEYIDHSFREKYPDLGDKIMVFSVPQMAEHNEVSWDIHKMNMRIICKEIKKLYGKVILSLHPKSKKEDYTYLENEGYGYITDIRLSEIMKEIDGLICCDTSSVGEWPLLLNKEQVLIDTDALMKPVYDCKSIFIPPKIEKEIQQRRKEDIKNVSKEIVKAIEYFGLLTK